MLLTSEELKQLKTARSKARLDAIQISKRFTIIKKVFYITEAEYDEKMRQYNQLDREYNFALYDTKQAKLRKVKSTKPYNAAKRTAAKALKALESLPKEMRDKIIADAQDGLF